MSEGLGREIFCTPEMLKGYDEHGNRIEKKADVYKEINTLDTKQALSCMSGQQAADVEKHMSFLQDQRWGVLTDKNGEDFSQYGQKAMPDLRLVSASSLFDFGIKKIDAGFSEKKDEPTNFPDDVEQADPFDKIKGKYERFEKELETKFRELNIPIYRVMSFDESKLGNSEDLDNNGVDLIYGAPFSKIKELEEKMGEISMPLLERDDFSADRDINLNIDPAKKNNYGFRREFVLKDDEGERKFIVEFVCLQEKNK